MLIKHIKLINAKFGGFLQEKGFEENLRGGLALFGEILETLKWRIDFKI